MLKVSDNLKTGREVQKKILPAEVEYGLLKDFLSSNEL
jgi:hypothetical protein